MSIKTWPPSSTYIPPGVIARSDLTEDALAVYGIPINRLMAADGVALAIAETAGDHYLSLSANVITLLGEIANNNTKTDVSYFQFILPSEYVAAEDVRIRVKHQATGAGTLGATKTIDVEAYEQTGNGAVGSDLVTTAAQTVTKSVWATSDFVVTATNLVAGDILIVKLTTAIQETAIANIQVQVDGIAVLLDVKG